MAHAQPVSSFRQEPRVSIRGQRVDPVDEKVDVEGPPRYDVSLAEEVGFEPTEPCGSHAFQACRFGRSRTPPDNGARTEARHNDTTTRRHFRSTTAEVYMVATRAPLPQPEILDTSGRQLRRSTWSPAPLPVSLGLPPRSAEASKFATRASLSSSAFTQRGLERQRQTRLVSEANGGLGSAVLDQPHA